MTDQERKKEQRVKQLARVVCICKGIKLKQMLPAIKSAETVKDVNDACGSGSGGCKGERCGPRIKALIQRYQDQLSQQQSGDQSSSSD